MVKQRGYSLIEVVFAMAIFGIFCAVLFTLTAEMRFWEKRLPVNMHKNPQVINVLARLRRDVLDAAGAHAYRDSYGEYEASAKVLIIDTIVKDEGQRTVVWDFRTPGQVLRREYQVGVARDWVSRGLPVDFSSLQIDAVKVTPGSPWAVQIKAKDERGRLAIYAILQPRTTQ